MSQNPQASLRARHILVAAVAIGLAGGFGEQALAVELPPAPETVVVPAVDAVQVPTPEKAAAVVEQAVVEQAVQAIAEAAPAAPLPAAKPVVAVIVPAAKPTTVPAGAQPTAKSAKQPVRRDLRPARAARKTAARGDTTHTVSPTTSAAERLVGASSLLPREAGAVPQRPPLSIPSGADGTALLQGASGGGPAPLPAAALLAAFDVSPDAGTRVVPVSTLLRGTLFTSFPERPG